MISGFVQLDRESGEVPERLGDILLSKGLITQEQLLKSLEAQRRTGDYLGEVLIHLGYAEPGDVYRVLSRQRGLPYIDIANLDIESEVLGLIPREFAERYTLIPLAVDGVTLKVAVADHLDVMAFDGISALTGLQPELMLCSRREIRKAIRENYARPDEIEKDMKRLLHVEAAKEEELRKLVLNSGDEAEIADSPAIRFVNLLLQQAAERKASDLHLEPHKDSVVMRYRIDGILHDATPPTASMHASIVSRIKILANLDIAEHRLPQDGRFRLESLDIDIRVSIVPTIHGEKVQMRFLDKARLVVELSALGMDPRQEELYKETLRRTQGIILVTGPTGSGKTTTLYSGLAYINTPGKNIMTVEDPVEYVFPAINQIQIRPEINLRFATALRSILRQDPDVIMVGEIRDHETGEIAIRASLTGHLVLSTLHTNTAAAAISTLTAMGTKSYLLASSLSLIIAQRLIRRICHRCKEVDTPDAVLLEKLKLDPKGTYYKGKGCRYCNDTGYRGQVAVFELLPITRSVARLISRDASEQEITAVAVQDGLISLLESGAEKVRQGITSAEEVLARISSEQEE